jgi:GTP-binding protein LepA
MDLKNVDLKAFTPDKIRNFSIIAHIDHGKSTLADRLLERCGTISDRTKNEQVLDKLQVERERGITVKAQTASLFYEHNGVTYLLNLIDTPGHVDFSYEVSRSLYACQGALLVVDAAQGVQAQTVANFYLAFEQDLTIIPVINKIDMNNAQPERVAQELARSFDLDADSAIKASAKAGIGLDEILSRLITATPAPSGEAAKPTRLLLFDSWFDNYRGVICLVEVVDGMITKGETIVSAHTGEEYEILELGLMYPDPQPMKALYTGQVGYIITGMKTVREALIGDTFHKSKETVVPLPGFKKAKAMVFAGIYPVESNDFSELKEAIEKLCLNDPSISYEKETSAALGFGFRCGFLGLLHMDVFRQRLEQEYEMSIITTTPTVLYNVHLSGGGIITVENPSDFPDPATIESIEEPMVKATIITPHQYLGRIITLCQKHRGEQTDISYIDEERVIVTYTLPLAEIVTDFYDSLKSVSAGYASFDYEAAGYAAADMVKMNILLNGEVVDALSTIVHREKSYAAGRDITAKLKEVVHRQQFVIAIQAALGAKIIARETISALRKDVTQKLYGGDVTRKKKLLEKQKKGKKRMKQIGNVELPQEAFFTILKK